LPLPAIPLLAPPQRPAGHARLDGYDGPPTLPLPAVPADSLPPPSPLDDILGPAAPHGAP
ncbi:MAG TPA: hypothetical protein VGD91_29260, partial [Trebonia sp.]